VHSKLPEEAVCITKSVLSGLAAALLTDRDFSITTPTPGSLKGKSARSAAPEAAVEPDSQILAGQ